MSDFDGGVRILDLDGGLVLDLGAGGYAEGSVSEDTVTWRRVTIESPFVAGNFEVQAVEDATSYTLLVHIIGSTWAGVEQMRAALEAAVKVPFIFELRLDGVAYSYRASRADISAPRDAASVVNRRRDVVLSFPVQPNPTVRGI